MPGPGGRRGGPGGPRGMGGKPKGDAKKVVARLLSYIGAYKYLLVLAFVFLILSTLAGTAASYLLRPIVNAMVDTARTLDERLAYVVRVVVMLLIVYGVQVVMQYAQAKIMLTISQNAMAKLRRDLFAKIERLPVKFFDNESHGEIMSRFTNDVDNVATMFDSTLTSLVSGTLTLIATFSVMCYTNIWLTLITLAFIPVYLFGGRALSGRSRKYYVAQQAALGAVNGYIEESVSGQKVIKVFNHEATCVDEFELLNDDLREKQIGAQFCGGIMGPVMGNTGQVSYALTAGIGGILCIARGFDIGGLTIFVNYARQFSRPINEISMQMSTVFAALAGAERVFDVLDRPEEEPDKPDAADMPHMQGYVKLDDVTFGYVPGKTILKHISLYAKPGQKIAFVGSTGAGKTTITNLINRFYDIQGGHITYDGIDVRDIKKDDLRRSLGIVLQDTHLFTGSVMENIRYGRLDATDEDCIRAAKIANAHYFILHLPQGYNTMLYSDGANLSQGQRQLVAIARAAVSEAPVLILDEATSSVDTRTEKLIEKGLDGLMAGRTVFVIAHRLSTVRNANAILVLEQGRVIERGSHADLLEQHGKYYQLYTNMIELA